MSELIELINIPLMDLVHCGIYKTRKKEKNRKPRYPKPIFFDSVVSLVLFSYKSYSFENSYLNWHYRFDLKWILRSHLHVPVCPVSPCPQCQFVAGWLRTRQCTPKRRRPPWCRWCSRPAATPTPPRFTWSPATTRVASPGRGQSTSIR